MTDIDPGPWLNELMDSARRYGLIFVQLGCACEPLRSTLLTSGHITIDARKLLEGDSLDGEHSVVIVDNVESFVDTNERSLGSLRVRVNEILDRSGVILVSRAPKLAYPSVPGSHVIEDAKTFHRMGYDFKSANDWPGCSGETANVEGFLERCLGELGIELCSLIDRVLYEIRLDDRQSLQMFQGRELDSLCDAGLVHFVDGEARWVLKGSLLPLKEALSHVMARQYKPQASFDRIATTLWEIERLIRAAAHAKAVECQGNNWRKHFFSGQSAAAIVETASVAAYQGIKSINEIRDPFEWITLGQLLELIARKDMARLGVPEAVWNKFRIEVLPIRNQMAHMRLFSPGDLEVVTRWAQYLRSALKPLLSPTRASK